jgi:hypothetical protein
MAVGGIHTPHTEASLPQSDVLISENPETGKGSFAGDLGNLVVHQEIGIDAKRVSMSPEEIDSLSEDYAADHTDKKVAEYSVSSQTFKQPDYGYLGYTLREPTSHRHYKSEVREALDAHGISSEQKDIKDRTIAERYVRGNIGPQYGYGHHDFSERVAGIFEGTEVDKKGEPIELEHIIDPSRPNATHELEELTELFIKEGLAEFTDGRCKSSTKLQAASKILLEATRQVPDFDPEAAGFAELLTAVVVYKSALEADVAKSAASSENPHWAEQRAESNNGIDPLALTVNAVYTNTRLTLKESAIKALHQEISRQK